jgi:hypothetical protein
MKPERGPLCTKKPCEFNGIVGGVSAAGVLINTFAVSTFAWLEDATLNRPKMLRG